ncbi:sialoadhesin-like [Pseudorasbora parva]|uniref:sialoadhesin-like n=1 Tax=Pseudorasbora parva TaxID=51549 RepID=UPI00351DEC9F
MDAALAPMRLQGIRVLNYIDNWLIMAKSHEMAIRHRDVILAHLRCLGLRLNTAKSVLIPAQRTTFLGVVWDSTSMRASMSTAWVGSILAEVSGVKLGHSRTVKQFQRLLGLMAAASNVIPLVRLGAQNIILMLLILRVSSAGWGVSYSPSHICALKDSTVIMRCSYTYPTGHQIRNVFWTKDYIGGEEHPDLAEDPEYSQRLQYLGDKQQICTVRLSHVTLKDSHEYYFRFTTDKDGGRWTGNPGVTLTVTDLQVESPERVTEGDSVRLTCKSSCTLTDRATFIWSRNSQPLTERRDGNNELLLQSVRREDAGRYSCAVHGHTHTSPDVHLHVMYPPRSVSVSISPSGVIVEGDSVTLSCSSDSNPPALNFSWFKGGTFVGSGRIYSILNISSDDSGEYKCKSINEHGEKYSNNVTLNVMYPPRSVSVSISPSGVIVEGDSVTLNCSSDSNPPALNFSWFKGGTIVGSGRIYSISNISSDDSGEYKCKSINEHGEKYSDAVTLNVMYLSRGGLNNSKNITSSTYYYIMDLNCVQSNFILETELALTTNWTGLTKRMKRRSAVKETSDPTEDTYTALELKSTTSDLYDTLAEEAAVRGGAQRDQS